MEGFTYHNIFDTKGIEYLFIIAFFLILIPFWILLNKKVNINFRIKKILGILSSDKLKIPHGVYISNNHTWTHLEKSGFARIGLDDLLMHLIGEVKIKVLVKSGDRINKNNLIAEVYQDEKVLKIYSPVSGNVSVFNSLLDNEAKLLNEDPFGKGWIIKLKPTNWIEETKTMYLAEKATTWSETELERFKDFVQVSLSKNSTCTNQLILQEGGEICDHPLSDLQNEIWLDFQDEFLNPAI